MFTAEQKVKLHSYNGKFANTKIIGSQFKADSRLLSQSQQRDPERPYGPMQTADQELAGPITFY